MNLTRNMTDFTSGLPRALYRAAQVRQLDRIAVEDFSIPGFRLMRTAGAVAFKALREQWPQVKHVRVFAGGGNNGGDGYIVAGLARETGLSAEVVQLSDGSRLTGDAGLAFAWAQEKQVAMLSFDGFQAAADNHHAHTVVVDALLGTGLDREVSGDYRAAIELINASRLPVLAIDIPSGLGADTGVPLGTAVKAELTVTFIGMKQGLLTAQGRDFSGAIVFNALEVPDEIYSRETSPVPSARRIDINDAAKHLPPRVRSAHKGSYGHVLVMGGDYGFGGAALMAAEAAARAGAGLVSLLTRSVYRTATLARRPEVMVSGTEDDAVAIDELIDAASVIAVGPGLGRSPWSRRLLQLALAAQSSRGTPLVIDADGLRLLAERAGMAATVKRDNWILTPHPGEAATLLDCTVKEIQDDRFAAVANLNARWGGCSLLKGSGSLICCGHSEQRSYLCTEGNAGMASGGMGDVLTGIIAGLVAQGLSLEHSLCCAVSIHGEAADLVARACGQRGMLATDLFAPVHQLVNPTR